MKTTKFIPLLEEAFKEQVSEILMFGTPGASSSVVAGASSSVVSGASGSVVSGTAGSGAPGSATSPSGGGTQIFFKYPQGLSVPYRQDVPFLDLQNFARGLKPAPRGHFMIGRKQVIYQIEMAPEMTQVHLALKYANPANVISDFDLAPHVFDSIFKPGAFSIVSGQHGSGRSRFLEQISQLAIKRKKLATCLFEDAEFTEVTKDVRVWTRQENKAVPPFLFAGADILLVDLKSHVPADELLKAAERGTSVVLVVNAPNVVAGIFRCLSLFKAALARERFSQVFECAVGLYAVKGTSADGGAPLEFVNEVCLVTADLRTDLLAERLEQLFKRRTFNQTLLQYLLKRKIDLKAGFQLSPDPEELDSMLKKIGF